MVPMSSDSHRGPERRAQAFARHVLVPLFEGGEAGRRRAVLIFLVVLGPVALTITTLLSEHSRPWLAVARFSALGLAIAYLAVRRGPSRAEWYRLLLLIALAT